MPIKVFGNSNSKDNGKKIDTATFAQKPYLILKYMKSNIEANIDLRNQFRIKSSPDSSSVLEEA